MGHYSNLDDLQNQCCWILTAKLSLLCMWSAIGPEVLSAAPPKRCFKCLPFTHVGLVSSHLYPRNSEDITAADSQPHHTKLRKVLKSGGQDCVHFRRCSASVCAQESTG